MSLSVAVPLYADAANQTWNTAGPNDNWSTVTTPADTNWDAGVVWTQGNSAIFGGTGETVTLTEGITVGDITFNSGGYVINGNTLTLGASTIATGANNATIGSILAGASLTKTGSGTLTLSGTNSYNGITTINGGVVSVGTLAANATNSGIGTGTDLALNGGTLRYTGGNNGSDAGAKFNRNISVGASGGTIDVAGSGFLFYGGTLSGSGTLKIIDSSGDANNRQLLVTGNSAGFTGNVEIGNGTANSGWVQYRSSAANPFGSGTITILTGGVLSSDNGSTSPTTLSNNIVLSGGTLMAQSAGMTFAGTVTVTTGTTSTLQTISNNNVKIGGNLVGNGTLQKAGGNDFSVELRGDNSGFTGTYNHTADGATILYTANSGSAAAAWTTNTNAGARIMAGGTGGLIYKLGSLSGTTGRIDTLANTGNSTFEIGALNTSTNYGGVIQNGGASSTVGITKVGSGSLTLSGNNTYAGATNVNAGTLIASHASALGTGSVTINGGNLSTTVSNLGTGSMSLLSGSFALNGTAVGTETLGLNQDFTMSGGQWTVSLLSALNFDQIIGNGVNADFVINGGVLDLGGGSINYGTTYNLLTGFATGSVSNLAITNYDTANYTASLGTNGMLSFNPVPEPSLAALAGFGSLAFLLRRRR